MHTRASPWRHGPLSESMPAHTYYAQLIPRIQANPNPHRHSRRHEWNKFWPPPPSNANPARSDQFSHYIISALSHASTQPSTSHSVHVPTELIRTAEQPLDRLFATQNHPPPNTNRHPPTTPHYIFILFIRLLDAMRWVRLLHQHSNVRDNKLDRQ